ncbi:pre-mRNA-splicing factor 38B [Lolium rigidum]|uniref:pre-mRNA-splicing factor 38B n=1 Tax=Lolium rigidum TaxID=89674 RepID=UPI001F5C10B5|nr:pre-mRNA-splicing factor 38B [Lolium rigidum]
MGEEPEDRKRTTTTTAPSPREPFRREGRDSHARRPHSSSRPRRDDPPSPRRWRDDRRHESDRSHHRRRAEESAIAGDHDERRNRPLQAAQARRDDPGSLRWEGKRPPGDVKDDPPARHERSPRGTKRFSETREAWQPRSSFFQHDERDSAGHGGRRYGRQDYGRHWGHNEHLDDRDKHKSEGHGLQEKVEQAQPQNDVDSTWKHDGFFKLEEEAPAAKRRPGFKERGMPLEEQGSAVTEPDARSRKPGLTSGMGEERRNYHSREFVRPDDRGARRGFSDYRSAGQRNGYDSRGRGFAGRGGRGRDRFEYQYGGRNNMHEAAGEQTEKWKHDLYDQKDNTPAPMTEEEQIAKVEALLAL